jgi:hypothetical protein
MAKKGLTRGRVRGSNIPGVRPYYKGALRKVVFRPVNVIRSSDRVIAINQKLEEVRGTDRAPARKCKGRPWAQFVECLRDEMKKLVQPLPK